MSKSNLSRMNTDITGLRNTVFRCLQLLSVKLRKTGLELSEQVKTLKD